MPYTVQAKTFALLAERVKKIEDQINSSDFYAYTSTDGSVPSAEGRLIKIPLAFPVCLLMSFKSAPGCKRTT